MSELQTEYEIKRPAFDQLKGEIIFALEDAIKKTGVDIHTLSSRVKTLESIQSKARRFEIKAPLQELNDIVGVRVVCLFLSDVPRLLEAARKCFKIISEDDKINSENVELFGYMSLHMIGTMPDEHKGPRYDHIKGMKFELQIRTILMDAWANVSHHLAYKKELDVPRDLRRDFHALSGLFYVADQHFEIFFRSSQSSQREMANLLGAADPAANRIEINADTLRAYLAKKFPDREGHAGSLSVLIGELAQAGYRWINDLDAKLSEAWDIFVEYEKQNRLPESGMFIREGVVRVALGLVDDNFERIVHKNLSEKYMEQVLEERRSFLEKYNRAKGKKRVRHKSSKAKK
ncbi:MAG TPA: hypothetical protein VF794_27855 [Archangium sp.]|jgi:ppGpp synthetase/RelA/SpoT-type nucleotidyltranferase|uniref:GTP pyrophosphokinase n=1 Tax=Archangium sp. TaxID=1872627 RepID=UPI002ED8C804